MQSARHLSTRHLSSIKHGSSSRNATRCRLSESRGIRPVLLAVPHQLRSSTGNSRRRSTGSSSSSSSSRRRRSTGSSSSSRVSTQSPGLPARDAELRELVSDRLRRHSSEDTALVCQEAGLAFGFLQQSQSGALAGAGIWDAADLVCRAFELTDLLATGSTFRTLQMLKRHPGLLQLTPGQVATKVLQLKLLMPAANIAELLYQKPTLLLLDDIPGVCGGALKKLAALMPGIPIQAKLHEGGTVFWSFASLLPESSSSNAARAPAAAAAAAAAASAAASAAAAAAAAAAVPTRGRPGQ